MRYTVDELARILGKNKETIRRWCRDGKVKSTIESRKVGYIIEYDDPINGYKVDESFKIKHNELVCKCKCKLHRMKDRLNIKQLDNVINYIDELIKEESN